jgi:hypothetical protein
MLKKFSPCQNPVWFKRKGKAWSTRNYTNHHFYTVKSRVAGTERRLWEWREQQPQPKVISVFVQRNWGKEDIYVDKQTNKNKLRGLSPCANYTDLSAKVNAKFCEYGECRVVSWADPHVRNLAFLDRSRYSFFQLAPQQYSGGWVDPVPNPLLLRKSGSTGNRTRVWIRQLKESEKQKLLKFAAKGIMPEKILRISWIA